MTRKAGEPAVGGDTAAQTSRRRARLMALTQQGDSVACRALLDDLGPLLINFLRRRIADPSEVEDLYQETILSLFQARHTYDPSRPLEPWLFAIARNVAADHARRYWRRVNWEELMETLPDRIAAGEGPAREPDIEKLLADLPPAQRDAFRMLRIEGLSLKEAAGRAGTTVGALKVRAHRAYEAIKRRIRLVS